MAERLTFETKVGQGTTLHHPLADHSRSEDLDHAPLIKRVLAFRKWREIYLVFSRRGIGGMKKQKTVGRVGYAMPIRLRHFAFSEEGTE